jgi:hypothetical protein
MVLRCKLLGENPICAVVRIHEKHVYRIDIPPCKYRLDCDAVAGKLGKHKQFSANIHLGYFILSMGQKLRLQLVITLGIYIVKRESSRMVLKNSALFFTNIM